ncbi:MAG: hypothetical protein AB1635_11245 [Acidobacteriota bacterium]
MPLWLILPLLLALALLVVPVATGLMWPSIGFRRWREWPVTLRRSGNLWMAAILHAIGNAYIVVSVGSPP